MTVNALLETLKRREGFRNAISHMERIPSRDGRFGTLRKPLPSPLLEYLETRRIRLYNHQCEAIDLIREGRHTILATGTSSGKTLSFLLPIFEKMMEDPEARALLVYPAKALANDQLHAIREMERFTGCEAKAAVYDGDTPQNRRAAIRDGSRIVLTNPYELHHVLPWHGRWSGFFRNLAFVVIDEAHRYRGILGSNAALLFRRLRRLCAHHGASPIFFLSSATLANPREFAERLTGLDFQEIREDGSPQGERYFVLFNPFNDGSRQRNAHVAAKELLIAGVEHGLQTLCFTSSRRMAELIARWAIDDLSERASGYSGTLACYRAGYLPEERRALESRLRQKELKGVVTTNALELGIDIGSLDAVVLCGYPGTIISTKQQAGRAGRRGKESIAILVAHENPLDQYFMKHPDAFFGRPLEHAILDERNPYIVSGHVLCAASELPLNPEWDRNFLGEGVEEAATALAAAGLLRRGPHGYVYTGKGRATEAVQLDSIASDTFKVICEGRVIETMDRMQAFREAHPGAVLLHMGETYLVHDFDLEERSIRARRTDVDYHTEAVKISDLSILRERERHTCGDIAVVFGDVETEERYIAYRIIQHNSVVKTEPLDLPPLRFETRSCWLEIPCRLIAMLHEQGYDAAGALHGMEHAMIGMMPFHLLCDRWDIGGLSTISFPSTGRPTVFVYDGCRGGIGLSEKAFQLMGEILQTAARLVEDCSCENGCPSCIYSPKCGNDNRPLDKGGAALLLRSLCEGLGAGS